MADLVWKVAIYLRRIGAYVFFDLILCPSQNERCSEFAKRFGELVSIADLVMFRVFCSAMLDRPKNWKYILVAATKYLKNELSTWSSRLTLQSLVWTGLCFRAACLAKRSGRGCESRPGCSSPACPSAAIGEMNWSLALLLTSCSGS